MLSLRHIPRTQIAIPKKWISIVHNTIRLSSNSSSSDSSDSDSDLDSKFPKQTVKMAKGDSNVEQKKDLNLYELIDHYMQKTSSKQVDIKINEKDKTELLEHRIMKAAEVLTSSVGGDKEKIVSSLLYSLSAIKSKKPTTSTEPIRESSESKGAGKIKHERFKTKTNNTKSRFSESKGNKIKMERDSISKRLVKMDMEQNREESISKLLLRKTPKPSAPSIIKELLIVKEKQSSVIQQLSSSKELVKKSRKKKRKPPSSEEHQNQEEQSSEEHQNQEEQSSVIKALLKDYHGQRRMRQESQEREGQLRAAMSLQEPSISKMMLSKNKPRRSRFEAKKPKKDFMRKEAGVSPLHWILFDDDVGKEKRNQEDMSTYFEIFGETNTPSKTVELDTWNTCEEKFMKMTTKHYPENAFQEMAQWTEEGKMWNFPINNEQGMDEEQSIHFSEHVFLEQHLAGWCPTKGPIRHFMELVCIGLSKNPYMTVQEKQDTIVWYREFFADKNDLLKKLGLSEIEQNAEKQAQLAQ